MALTYTQQVAAIDQRLARMEASMDEMRREMLKGFAALAATAAVPAPADAAPPAVTQPPATSPGGGYTRPQRAALPPIIKTPAQLASAKLVLPYAAPRNPLTYPNYARGSYQAVGLTNYMPTTGERQEIGLVTDAQGAWLCGGSPNNMLVQAEAHADVPVHFGKVDLTVTPWAQCYEDNPAKGSPYFNRSGYAVMPEVAHYPSVNFIPYLATRDLFYLDELQAEATFMLIAGPGVPGYRPLIEGGQPRGVAWTVRALASAYLATQEAEASGALPSHLFPSSYWKSRLDIHRDALLAKYVNNSDPRIQAFRTLAVDFNFRIAPWEQDYIGAVLGWMVWTGRLDDWRPIHEWAIGQAIRRAAFGAKAIGYDWKVGTATDYASLIAANPAVDDANYKVYFRANLKIAALNGVAGADAAFTVADGLARGYVPYKWAV